jgi:diguanylate cyclase (GGDEF)-like protein
MPNPETSILVVDDAKFSTTVITRTLKAGGYTNIRHAASAKEALEMQEKSPASIIIADWLMPEMDGLEMTQRIRISDEVTNSYTYIIMLTAKDGVEALKHAFEEGIDDFVNKSVMQHQLLPRVFAAERLADNQNRLLRANQHLLKANQTLQESSTIDPHTGLGNRNYARRELEITLKHCDSRGDAASLILVEIADWQRIREKHPEHICNEIITGVSRRIHNMVRPLDHIARINEARFAIITHQPSFAQSNANSYRRIYDAINVRAIKTSTGYLSIKANMGIVAAHRDFGVPGAEKMLQLAIKQLEESEASGKIVEHKFRQF